MDMTVNDISLSLQGRIRAMLHGIALGDAMGAPVEKLSAAEISKRYGRVTSLDTRWHKMDLPADARNGRIRGNGIVTDDTLMTLCVMEVYAGVNRHLDAWDMADGMVKQIAWTPRYVPEHQREMMLVDRLFYPEKWIFQRHQLSAVDPRQGGIGNMVNCGAAMYIAPIGAANAGDPWRAYGEAIAFASGHQQSYGLEAAGVMAAAVAAAFTPGITIDEVADYAAAFAKDGTYLALRDIIAAAREMRGTGASHAAVTARFHQVIAQYSPIGDDVNHTVEKAGRPTDAYQPSRKLSIEELPLAIGYAVVNDGEFRTSIEDGINSGRDTDSIGVMTGAILGALHGESVIREEDRALLDSANRMNLTEAADRFTLIVRYLLRGDTERRDEIERAREILMANPPSAKIVNL
jgi:ADP-ribosylglycohydrolase